MTNNSVLSIEPALGWQLQAEFRTKSSLGGDRQLAEQVTETMRELNLPTLQLEWIQKAALEAVQRASRRGQPDKPVSPVHFRIWVASEYASGRGSGFFLVEKPGCDLQGTALGAECLVELFLYQERNS